MELSIRAYAKHRGVSDTAVRKAIKSGRITQNNNGKIDPVLADQEWDASTDPARQREIIPAPVTAGPNYQQSRAIREAYEAKLKKLEYDVRTEKLIAADQVKVSAFNTARMTRNRILNVPDRVVPLLMDKAEAHEMKAILRAELIKALEELAGDYDDQ